MCNKVHLERKIHYSSLGPESSTVTIIFDTIYSTTYVATKCWKYIAKALATQYGEIIVYPSLTLNF